MNNLNVKVSHFSGARIRGTARVRAISQLNHPIIKKKPEFLMLHIGTYDDTTNDSRKIVDDILLLKSAVLKSLPVCRVIVSKPAF